MYIWKPFIPSVNCSYSVDRRGLISGSSPCLHVTVAGKLTHSFSNEDPILIED